MGNKGKMKNLKKEKKTPKNDIGYGTKVAALKDMKIHNMDFDVFNEGFENVNHMDFDVEKIIEDFENNA
jgi:hypothetical protein|tara:strand:+ start:355 stop:561 length:207 start_codon:yes stop_codon:yes gene_type:complete